MSELEISMPYKLSYESECIKAHFYENTNFIEGENSSGYPTPVLNTTWYQFPPKNFGNIQKDLMRKLVELYNHHQIEYLKRISSGSKFEHSNQE